LEWTTGDISKLVTDQRCYDSCHDRRILDMMILGAQNLIPD